MKQHFLPCLLALAFAVSCSPKDEVPAEPEKPKDHWYLYGWMQRDLNDPSGEKILAKIEYNADSTVKKKLLFDEGTDENDPGIAEEATYTNGKLSKIDVYYSTATPYFSVTYEHKENRLVRALNYAPVMGTPQLELQYIDSFFYAGSGRLTSHMKHESLKSGGTIRTLTEYTWSSDNVTSAKSWQTTGSGTTLLTHYDFEYSNLVNFSSPYFDSDFIQLASYNSEIHNRSRNLCTRRIHVVRGPVAVDTTFFQYTFAENGLPATKEERFVSGKGAEHRSWGQLYTFDFRKLTAN